MAKFRCNFRVWDKEAGKVILPVASTTTIAVSPADSEACGAEAASGQEYTAAMVRLRELEASIKLRQHHCSFVPVWMRDEVTRLRAIESVADKQIPSRAAAASQTAAEEAARLTIEVAELQAKLNAAHKEATESAG